MKLKRLISALLLLAMLLSCLPLSVLAVDGENFFYFSAETAETLVVSPQKIPYSDGQTIAEALETAGVALTFDGSSGFVTAINGVSGNYVYRGDFPEQGSLISAANSVKYLFFSEDTGAVLGAGRKALMRPMTRRWRGIPVRQRKRPPRWRKNCLLPF